MVEVIINKNLCKIKHLERCEWHSWLSSVKLCSGSEAVVNAALSLAVCAVWCCWGKGCPQTRVFSVFCEVQPAEDLMGEWRQQEEERLLPTRVSLEQPLFQLPSPGSLLVSPLRHLPASLALAEAVLRALDVPGRQPFPRGLGPSGAARLLGAQSLVLLPSGLQS